MPPDRSTSRHSRRDHSGYVNLAEIRLGSGIEFRSAVFSLPADVVNTVGPPGKVPRCLAPNCSLVFLGPPVGD